ncbi:MAG: hypothetical protein JNK45_14395 [Myxococcales bacterium]|nr:hypothetical protein [Myxococcales bacterium]
MDGRLVQRRWLGWVFGLLACDTADKGVDSDANLASESSTAGSSESGGETSSGCVRTPTVLPDVDAVGVTGLRASDLLAEAEGTFTGQIAWLNEPPLTYTGTTDPSALTLTLQYDGGEIRSIDAELGECPSLGGCACEDRLEVDVTWRLTSADGVLDETWVAPLLHEPQSWTMAKPIGIATEFQPDDTQGSLSAASFTGEGELQSLTARATFRNGAAQGSIDGLVLWNEWIGAGAAATFAALKDGAQDTACHELTGQDACAFAGCVPVGGHQQILDCQCGPDEVFCFAVAPPADAPLAWYTHQAGDTWDQYDQVVALPSFGDVTPAPWTACVDAPEIPGCECATEAPACG